MKIDRMAAEGRNLFTGYGEGYVEVNGQRLGESLVVGALHLEPWSPRSLEEVTAERIAALLEREPEIVLLGSGARFRFPEAAVLAPLYQARVGVEVMDTPAACRTFNILAGEGRGVVAALIVD